MNWDKLEISILIAGALIAVAGKTFGFAIIVSLGAGLIVLDIALVGVEGIITRKMKWGVTQHYSETYQGVAAISLGTMMLIAGAFFEAMVVAQALHHEEVFLELIFARPGPILLLIGIPMILRGLADLIGASEWDNTAALRFGGFFQRVSGFLLFLLGALCSSLGILDMAAPGTFQWIVSTFGQMFVGLFGIH